MVAGNPRMFGMITLNGLIANRRKRNCFMFILTVYINGKSVGVGEIAAVETQSCMLTLRTEVTLEIKA